MRAAPPLRVHFNPARPTFISEGVSHDSIVRGGILHPTGDQKILIPKQIGHSRFVYLESEPARTVAPSRTGGETAEISTQPLIPVIADNCGKNRDWRKQYNIHILQRNCQKPKNPPPIQIVACGQLRTAGMWRSHTPPSPAWSSPRAPVYFQSAHAPPLTIPSSPDSPTTPSLLNYGEIPPPDPEPSLRDLRRVGSTITPKPGVSPLTEEDAAATTAGTLQSFAATRTLTVPATYICHNETVGWPKSEEALRFKSLVWWTLRKNRQYRNH